MEGCFVSIVIWVIGGAICAGIASSKGRNPAGWFFAGFFSSILLITLPIPIIIVLCMSNLNEENARRQYVDMEQRRLREQLRQEQLKVEAMRQYNQARLDAHDQALGVDTRPMTALPGYQQQFGPYALAGGAGGQPGAFTGGQGPAIAGEAQAGDAGSAGSAGSQAPDPPGGDPNQANLAPAGPMFQTPLIAANPTQWYYECEGTTFGPVPESAIHMLLRSGRLQGSTLVWCQEFTEWTAASSVQIFQPSVIA